MRQISLFCPYHYIFVQLFFSSSSSPVSLRSCSSTSCLIESWRLSCILPPSPHCLLIDESKAPYFNLSKNTGSDVSCCVIVCVAIEVYWGLWCFSCLLDRIGTHFLKWENMGPLHALPSGDQQPNSKFWFSCPSSPFWRWVAHSRLQAIS